MLLFAYLVLTKIRITFRFF